MSNHGHNHIFDFALGLSALGAARALGQMGQGQQGNAAANLITAQANAQAASQVRQKARL